MSGTYRPRRQSSRWLDGDCPPGVLAIYDNGGMTRRNGSLDRYSIFYVPDAENVDHHGDLWIDALFSSDNPGHFGGHDQMRPHEVAHYRHRFSHHAARWSDLPDAVKATVRRDLTTTD